MRFASNLLQAPPICNRVNSPWNQNPTACSCEKWPQFLAQNLNITHLAKTLGYCTDADGVCKEVSTGDYVCYWRPGKQNHKWWYNGKVLSLQLVQFPSGKSAPVMGIN